MVSEDHCKTSLFKILWKSLIENLQLSCLIKVMYIGIDCPIWASKYSYLDSITPPKTFYASVNSETLCIARTTIDLVHMVPWPNHFSIWMKNRDSECTHIILLLKKMCGKFFEVFDRFADTADNFS